MDNLDADHDGQSCEDFDYGDETGSGGTGEGGTGVDGGALPFTGPNTTLLPAGTGLLLAGLALMGVTRYRARHAGARSNRRAALIAAGAARRPYRSARRGQRCVNSVTGALGTMQPGEVGMLQRDEFLLRYEALADQDSWCGTVRETARAGLEENAENVIRLTLDTLRNEGFIERARKAPYPKLQAALAGAEGS